MPNQPPARSHIAFLSPLLAFAAISLLPGCSDGGSAYPSLASRPVERLNDTAPTAPAQSGPGAPGGALAVSADLAARLDDLVTQARRAKKDFDDKQAATERLIAAAGAAPVGSEAWARATQALSGVQSARSQTAQPLSDLDRLDVEDRLHGAQIAADGPTPRPDTAAISHARDIISALVADEDAALVKLDGRLAR